jgi:succinate dehydrogenase / fumarate reductase cytochrome b subunit
MTNGTSQRTRPRSPNIQIYRPQLTSVLSITNRISGVLLSVSAIALVVWLMAAAAGPKAYATLAALIGSWIGQILLFGCTLSFFLHLCGSVRHLIWDAVYGFELRTIYTSGWVMLATTVLLTAITWIAAMTWRT